MRVAVVGLGKIGLPLAVQFASKGSQVIGCDTNPDVVALTNEGHSRMSQEPGLTEGLERARAQGLLKASADTAEAVARSEVVVAVVPVGIDQAGQADFRFLDEAATAIGRGLQPETLVILETTVPVGTTRNRFATRLKEATGWPKGELLLAYSPERVSSGSIFRDLATYPKLIGGLSKDAAQATSAFYGEVLDPDVLVLPDAETAELAKLAESVYRDVNIALANQLAMTADSLGIDYGLMASAANSQPFSHLHSPGVGVGGHCIPVYPHFFLEAQEQSLVRLSRQVNDSMAEYGAAKLSSALAGAGLELNRSRVLILGLSYRGGVKEATLSSALLLNRVLSSAGAEVSVHDPLFSEDEIADLGLKAAALPPETEFEAIVLQAGHPEYRDLDFARFEGTRVLLDGRGFFDRGRVEQAGVRYLAIGAP